MNPKLLYILLIVCIFYPNIFAQNYTDIVNVAYTQNADADYKGFDNTFNQKGISANFNVPIHLNEHEDVLMPNLNYRSVQLNNNFYTEDRLDFHDVHIGLSYFKNWKKSHWASSIEVGLSAASDFSNFNGNHLNYNTNLLLYYGKKESLVWNFGVDYVGGSFGSWLIPLLGVDWQMTEKLHFSFQTFSHFQLEYQFTERFAGGLQLENRAYSFNLSDYFGIEESSVYTYSNQFPFSPQKASLFLDSYLSEQAVIFGKIGVEFARELFHTDLEGNFIEESAYNGKIDTGLIFEIGFAWRTFK